MADRIVDAEQPSGRASAEALDAYSSIVTAVAELLIPSVAWRAAQVLPSSSRPTASC